MDLKNQTLDSWLKSAPVSAYRHKKKVDYHSLCSALKNFLETKIHDHVNAGSILKNPDILINDHGAKHIETVIERATDLTNCDKCQLSPFEVYILLQCIQLHDVGNIFGRYQHELNVGEIMSEAENLCGRDTVEAMLIATIAQAHGGSVLGADNGKDKISQLKEHDPLLDGEVKTRAIASILRFADELSDDKRRASVILLKDGRIPKKSEVFHAYASCLESVIVKHEDKTIELSFKVPKEFLTRKFGKMDEEILLLDEIYNRVMKMHLERVYCMRFLKGLIDLEKISVSIEFYGRYVESLPQLNFEVSESGYPSEVPNGIFGLCDALKDEKDRKIDGNYMLSIIKKLDEDSPSKKQSAISKIFNFLK